MSKIGLLGQPNDDHVYELLLNLRLAQELLNIFLLNFNLKIVKL